MFKFVIFIIVFIVTVSKTGVGSLIIMPYEGTWLQRLWQKAKATSQTSQKGV
jgi:hypothetical protein